MKDIVVRKATKDDAPLIANVVAMAIGDDIARAYCGDNHQLVLKELVCMELSQYSYRNAIIAEVDGMPAGAAVAYDGATLSELREATLAHIFKHTGKEMIIKEDETDASEFYLDSLGVLPEYRGCGIGAKLILALKEIARTEYHKRLGLLVDFENPKAERLYLSLGFEKNEEKSFLGHKMWHMTME